MADDFLPDDPNKQKLGAWYDEHLRRGPSQTEEETDLAGIGKYGWDAYAGDALAKRVGSTDGRAVDSQSAAGDAMYGSGSNNGASGGGSSASSKAWNSVGNSAESSLFPDWYHTIIDRQMQTQAAAQAENKAKSDSLWKTLSDRASQTLNVGMDDPVLRKQSDVFAARQEQGRRNAVSDAAVAEGPIGNIQGERRLQAERAAQATSENDANLMGRELASRRAEIAQALQTQGAMLSADQQREMQQEMGLLDQALAQTTLKVSSANANRGFDLQSQQMSQQNDQFLRNLGLNEWDRGMYYDLLQRGVI